MLLQNVAKVSNVVTKCYTVSQKCQMLLQSDTFCEKVSNVVTKCYNGVKCTYNVLQSVTKVSNVVTQYYKVLQKCEM